jgi:hypothetical protein
MNRERGADPYDVRVNVRLPGVIPGRAQVTVRGVAAQDPRDYRRTTLVEAKRTA